jgi:hypothetical protein
MTDLTTLFPRVHEWLREHLKLDAIFCLAECSRTSLRQLFKRTIPLSIWRPRLTKPKARTQSYWPVCEQLEPRTVMNSSSYGLGAPIGELPLGMPTIGDPLNDPLAPQPDSAMLGRYSVHVPLNSSPEGGGGGNPSNSGGGAGGGDSGGGGGSAPPPTMPDVGGAFGSPALRGVAAQPALASAARPSASAVVNASTASSTSQLPAQTTPEAFRAAAQQLATQAIAFELNEGQTDPQVKVLSRGAGYTLFLTGPQAVLTLPQPAGATGGAGKEDVVALTFAGANARASVVPQDELTYRTNYFLGSQSFTDVPNYARVEVQDLYQGISATYYGSSQGQLEYDLDVAPGADLSQVRMRYQGVAHMHTDADGSLELETASGSEVVQHAPSLYQRAADGTRQPVAGRFAINADGTVGFVAGAYDSSRPLVVDPTLAYSTYQGGSGTDTGLAIAVDGTGEAIITGQTASTDFPCPPFQNVCRSSGLIV